ncbi:MAG: glycosyltransferase family 2 protein [Actinobacteria bacterium]|nr:glycosyltransferase family 2 protein [Actinomycetota bacterium]
MTNNPDRGNNRNKYKDKNKNNNTEISIIIPIYNEEESIDLLYSQLDQTLSKLGLSYEVILIDDGSTDNTYTKLVEIHKRNSNYKIIKLRRNFGQTAAISAGFDYSRGNIIITLDADLQNDPGDIPKLIEKMKEGYDIVSGWRKNRKDKFLTRRIPSILANKIISRITGVHLHDFGCTLKAYSKDIVKNISLYGEMHRYIPAIASSVGAKITEIEVRHNERKFGKSKYGISRTIRVILDIITIKFLLSFSTKPMQLFGLLGLGMGVLGSIVTLYLIILRVFFQQELGNRPLFLIGIFLVLIGIQFISMGLIGEISIRTYHESCNKPIYSIKEILD